MVASLEVLTGSDGGKSDSVPTRKNYARDSYGCGRASLEQPSTKRLPSETALRPSSVHTYESSASPLHELFGPVQAPPLKPINIKPFSTCRCTIQEGTNDQEQVI